MRNKIWINEDGQYLTFQERTTHTGKHLDFDFTANLNEAYAGSLPQRTPHSILSCVKALEVNVETVRTVKLIIGPYHD